MQPISKLHLKIFFATGIPFGLIMVGMDMYYGDGFSLSKFLFLTFFFGITMAIILVALQRHRLRKNGVQDIQEENLTVTQEKTIISGLSKNELLQKLESDPLIGKMKIKALENGVLIRSGLSWKSWGEEIEITLTSSRESQFEYHVTSRSRLKTTLIDYGKNLENVNRISNILENDV